MLLSVDSHFEKRPPQLRKIYDKIIDAVMDFGPVGIEPIKSGIFLKKAGTFAKVEVKKDHLKVEFFLDHLHNAFPVEKTLQYTQKKIVHLVSVSSLEDVDKQLTGWLKTSYSLAK